MSTSARSQGGDDLHLSRATLRSDAPLSNAFWSTFRDPYGAHKLAWDFFPSAPDAKRDFLYRMDLSRAGPTFYIVSSRQPAADGRLWDIATAPYDPGFAAGERLAFALRANPARRSGMAGEKESTRSSSSRHDVVMNAKRSAPEGQATTALIQEAGTSWLARQGDAHGFRTLVTRAEGYRQHRFHAGPTRIIALTSIDYEGILEVIDAERFHRALKSGIGPAKGFGFGLLLVRRP